MSEVVMLSRSEHGRAIFIGAMRHELVLASLLAPAAIQSAVTRDLPSRTHQSGWRYIF